MYVFQIRNIKISFGSSPEIVNVIDKFLTSPKVHPHHIITLNSLIYLQSKLDHYVKNALRNATFVICDSYWISLLCSISSFRLLKYQPGVELVEKICILAKEKNYKMYLLGAKQDVVKTTAEVIKQKFGVNIVGYHHGYIFSSDELQYQVVENISMVSPDILFVGLPTELQERWIYKNIDKLNCKIVIGIGGSFDVISGKLKRAPKLFRMLGLEWYFRLLQQPWRVVRILKLPLAITLFFFDCLSWRIFRLFYK